MHKDLNAVKGGVDSLSLFWSSSQLPGPIPLPNKENTTVLVDPQAAATSAGWHAAESSSGGGVKVGY